MLFVPFDRRTFLKNELSGRRRMAWSSELDLDTIKSIGRKRGATVNDVLLSAMIRVNLRPIHWIEEMDDSMGNRFGLVFLDLPIHETTTESRFRGLKERMDKLKGTPEAFVAFGILNYAGKVIVGVRVDEGVSKDPGRLVELFEEEASGMFEGA